MELFERIRKDNREEGVSVRALARRYRVHRRTVREALAGAIPPARKCSPRPAPALDPHRAVIREWLTADLSAPRKQRHTARRVWQRLVDEHGASVSESTVRAYVGQVKAELVSGTRLAFVPQVHVMGEEAEVDFGTLTAVVAGRSIELSIFHMRLSASGRAFHICSPSEGQEAFLEGHVLAFAHFGGVPARIRYDNLTSAVQRVLRGRDRVEQERFIALRSHYGFDAFFCIPGVEGAHEKGGVEGEVGRFRRRHFVPVPQVASLAELNALVAAADELDEARHVDGRAESVGMAGAAEVVCLRPLPDEAFDPTVPLSARGDRRSRVWVRGSHYSVPVRFVGRRLPVALGARAIRVAADGHLVAEHERSLVKGAQELVLDHYLEVLARKPGALPGSIPLAQARASGILTATHERFWERARRKLGDAPGTRALIEVLLLERHLSPVAVHAALDAINAIGSVDPALVAIEARRIADGHGPTGSVEARGEGRHLRALPNLADYDGLLAGSAR